MRVSSLFVLYCVVSAAADGPRVIYTKSFPGSTPAFVAITLDTSGNGEYKEAADDESPLKFQIKPAEAGEIFVLISNVDRFTRPIESKIKVSKTGMTNFRLEAGPAEAEVGFTTSEGPSARELADWFDRTVETERS